MSGLTRRKAIRLTRKEKKEIKKILKSKEMITRVYKRASILRLVSSGYSVSEAASSTGLHRSTSWRICKSYIKGGLEEALYDRPRCGAPVRFTEKQKQRAIAMICSPAPKGLSRWTIQVIAEELRRRKIVSSGISKATVRLWMRSHELKPWREKNVVYR